MATETPIKVEVLELVARNTFGLHYIKEHGKMWVVKKTSPTVSFSMRPGPWLYLLARDNYGLWIHATNDFDVTIVRSIKMGS